MFCNWCARRAPYAAVYKRISGVNRCELNISPMSALKTCVTARV